MFKHLQKLFQPGAPPAPNKGLPINAYGTCADTPEPRFPHEMLGRRDLSDPALREHLQGFVGYVMQCGDGQMSRSRYHVMRHVQRVRRHFSMKVDARYLDDLASWARTANALLFMADGTIRDPQGRLLLSPSAGEEADPEAQVPYPDAAWQRKQRTDTRLSEQGINVAPSLPPQVSEPEVRMRSAAEVAARALALCAVAVRAESLSSGEPLAVADLQARLPQAWAHLSPREAAFLAPQDMPNEHDIAAMGWRYEALAVLAWATGWIGVLPFPSAICDVPSLVAAVLHHASQDPRSVAMRPHAEILDALDLHYRLHWCVVDARVNAKPAPVGLVGSVIAERHHALNWLVHFEDAAWDDVDTPT